MTAVFVGIDPSFTCTAIVALAGDQTAAHTITTRAGKLSPPARLVYIRERVIGYVDTLQPKIVFVEGYSRGSRNWREEAGELGGQIRVALWEAGYPYIVVAPPTLKKYITGNGKAQKSLILKEVFRRWGFDTDDDNVADAYGLARFAAEWSSDQWTKKFTTLGRKLKLIKPASDG